MHVIGAQVLLHWQVLAGEPAGESAGPLTLQQMEVLAADLASQVGPDKCLVGIGESSHQLDEVSTVGVLLARELIEGYGYRRVFVEGDYLKGAAAEEFVRSGRGNPFASLSFIDSWVDRSEVLFHDWLRAWNVSHPGDKVEFLPVDVDDAPLARLHAFGPEPVSTACPRAELPLPEGREAWARCAKAARRALKGVEPGSDSDRILTSVLDFAEKHLPIRQGAIQPRDGLMARSIVSAGAPCSVKGLFLGHNAHVAKDWRGPLGVSGKVSAGSLLYEAFGDQYAVVGVSASEGHLEDGTILRPQRFSCESRWTQLGAPYTVLDFATLVQRIPGTCGKPGGLPSWGDRGVVKGKAAFDRLVVLSNSQPAGGGAYWAFPPDLDAPKTLEVLEMGATFEFPRDLGALVRKSVVHFADSWSWGPSPVGDDQWYIESSGRPGTMSLVPRESGALELRIVWNAPPLPNWTRFAQVTPETWGRLVGVARAGANNSLRIELAGGDVELGDGCWVPRLWLGLRVSVNAKIDGTGSRATCENLTPFLVDYPI